MVGSLTCLCMLYKPQYLYKSLKLSYSCINTTAVPTTFCILSTTILSSPPLQLPTSLPVVIQAEERETPLTDRRCRTGTDTIGTRKCTGLYQDTHSVILLANNSNKPACLAAARVGYQRREEEGNDTKHRFQPGHMDACLRIKCSNHWWLGYVGSAEDFGFDARETDVRGTGDDDDDTL